MAFCKSIQEYIFKVPYLAHKIQLDPNNEQKSYFAQACGCARFAYNWALNEWKEQHKSGGKPNKNSILKKLNKIKYTNYPWMLDVTKKAIQYGVYDLGAAFTNFFKNKSKYPKLKKKYIRDSFRIEGDVKKGKNVVNIGNKKVKIPRLGWVKMREELRFKGIVKSVTISREADKWYASFIIEIEDHKKEHGNEVIGVDLGIKDAVVLSDGTKHTGPKPLKKNLRKLRRLDKSLSRKRKGSNNRKKAKLRLARLYSRIKNIRKDFLHKITSSLMSRAKTLVIEDLNVSGMVRNKRLSRAINDIGFYEFRRQLEYKCELSGCQLIIADRFYPSTQICSECGNKQKMPLGKYKYRCKCGFMEDRDINAAINLRNLAVNCTESINACGEESADSFRVKLTSVKQELSRR